jgi:hypothetical protein
MGLVFRFCPGCEIEFSECVGDICWHGQVDSTVSD